MKKLLFLLLLIPFLGTSQGTFTAPVGYNTGAPTAAPSGVGTRWRFDLLTGKKYTWNPDAVAWDEDPRGIDQISGCSAPMYTPGYNQSTFAVNSCSPTPELYQYTGSSWVKLNGGGSYTAGANIDITGNVISLTGNLPVERFNGGTNAASNTYWRGDGLWASLPGFLTSLNGLSPAIQTFATSTAGTDFSIQSFGSTHTFRLPTASATNRGALSSADWSTFNSKDPSSTNEIQTLSIAGQDLTLSNGGGTVAIPAGADGNGIYGGSGTIPDGTTASGEIGRWVSRLLFSTPSYYQEKYGDGFNTFGIESYDGTSGSSWFIGNTDDSPQELILQYSHEGQVAGSVFFNQTGVGFSGEKVTVSGGGSSLLMDNDGSSEFSSADGLGFQYASEYPDILTNNRSIPDVGLTKQLIASENGALGTGFTDGGGAGTIPTATATTQEFGIFQINYFTSATPALVISDDEGTLALYSPSGLGVFQFEDNSSTMAGEFVTLNGSSSVYVIAGDGLGAQYTADNSATIITNPASITDVRSVNKLKQTLVSYTTTQRNAISSPAAGYIIYCSDCTATDSSTGVQQVYNGSTWKNAW